MQNENNTPGRDTENFKTNASGGTRLPGSTCVCPRCGAVHPHTPNVPCVDSTCPTCGSPMCRKY